MCMKQIWTAIQKEGDGQRITDTLKKNAHTLSARRDQFILDINTMSKDRDSDEFIILLFYSWGFMEPTTPILKYSGLLKYSENEKRSWTGNAFLATFRFHFQLLSKIQHKIPWLLKYWLGCMPCKIL